MFTGVYKGLREFTRVYMGLQGLTRVYRSVHGYSRVYRVLLVYIMGCLDDYMAGRLYGRLP